MNILHEYGVSQMPVVNAEPPVMVGEVSGSVTERELLDALFTGKAALSDSVRQHMSEPLPLVGAGEDVQRAAHLAGDRRRGDGDRRRQADRCADQGRPAGLPRPLSGL